MMRQRCVCLFPQGLLSFTRRKNNGAWQGGSTEEMPWFCIQTKPFWHYFHVVLFFLPVGRFSYDLETKTREQNRNNKKTEIERYDWFIERTQRRVGFGWLSERSGEKTSCPRTF